jgi:mitochondrial fission protein ELM1
MAAPFGNAGLAGASTVRDGVPDDAPGRVWVLEDARAGAGDPCIAIAERLGSEFRRVSLCWSLRGVLARLPRGGSLAGLRSVLPLAGGMPSLTLSSGPRTASVAAWLKRACGSRMVHYGKAGRHGAAADLLIRDIAPRQAWAPGGSGAVLTVLGCPHRLSALDIRAARLAWRPMLDHLPRPRLALLLGGGAFGGEMQPEEAFRLGRDLAGAIQGAEGALLAVADRRAGREAAAALESGLAGCLHLLYREGEPGPDASIGYLASADAIVIAGTAPDRLLAACGFAAPVYVSHAGVGSMAQGALERRLCAAGHVRVLDGEIGNWRREPLDEAGRVAAAIRELVWV